jgi:hypothetical protein
MLIAPVVLPGNGDGMYAEETRGNAGSPSGDLLGFVFN